MGFAGFVNRARLPYVSHWINDDVRPIESARRTWGFQSFHNYWVLINCNISSFLSGSALIPLGLTWWQAVICIVIGNLVATSAMVLNSMAGAHYHVGFPVISRAAWGMWGSQFVIWNRIFLSLVWYGFQSWVGGQCAYLILLTWDPNLEMHIPNHMPASTAMTTAQFVGYIIFFVLSLPFIWIKPHKLRWFLQATSASAIIFFLCFLIWALATMGSDGFGDTLQSQNQLPATGGPQSIAWLMVYGIISTVGAIATGILNNNDYTRLARKPYHASWGQAIPFSFYAIVSAIFGILVVAATQQRLGAPEWNPPTILAKLLEKDPSSGTRAVIFFSGLALFLSQLGNNVPGSALAGGIDLASVFPRYINIRRGAYITAILSPIVNPWRLVGTATTFLSVVAGYGVFLAPMTGILVANYWLINRRKLDVDSLYRGDSSSIYWYKSGVNWRAPIAWVVGVAPCLPGFIATVNLTVKVPDGLIELYYMSYLYGFLASGAIYTALHRLIPVKEVDAFVNDHRSAAEIQSHFAEIWETDMHDSEKLTGPNMVYSPSHQEKTRATAGAGPFDSADASP